MEDRNMSFFQGPITNKYPSGETTIAVVYELIKSKKLKYVTEKVRSGALEKTELPYFTPSCTCSSRADDKVISYSGIMHLDFDDVLKKYGIDPETVKRLLSGDKELNFNLIFVSPSGNGLKAFLTVEAGRIEEHELYYSAVEKYILDTYGLKADSSCRNVSRACFLCHDPEPYWYKDLFVERETLLKLLPAPVPGCACRDVACNVSTGTSAAPSCNSSKIREISNSDSTGVPVFGKPDYTNEPRPSDLLNRLPQVHDRAVRDIQTDGWIQVNEVLWRRPGKEGGCSAIWNFWDHEGIFFFTNFSSNAPVFGRRGYTDVQIICMLEFNNDWNSCITGLAQQYLQ